MPCVSSARPRPRRPRESATTRASAASGSPASQPGDVVRGGAVRPRRPCAGSRRSGRGRTGRSRPGCPTTAPWPARCRSRSRSSGRARRRTSGPHRRRPRLRASSSSVTNVPGPLRHRDLLRRRRTKRTQPIEQHLDRLAVVAHRLGRVPVPGDRPVVVGAPDVDQVVEAAAELLGDVADVGREVGRLAVRADRSPGPCRRRRRSSGTRRRRPARRRGRRRSRSTARSTQPSSWSDASVFQTSKRTPSRSRLASIPSRTAPPAHATDDPRRRRALGGRLGPDVVRQLGASVST